MKSNNDFSSCFEEDNSYIVNKIHQSNKKDDDVPEFFELLESYDGDYIDDLYENPQNKEDVAIISNCNQYPEYVMEKALNAKYRVEYGTFIPIKHYSCIVDNTLYIWPMEKSTINTSNQENNQSKNIITIDEKCEEITCVCCGPSDQTMIKESAPYVIVIVSNRNIEIIPVYEHNPDTKINDDKLSRTSLVIDRKYGFSTSLTMLSDHGMYITTSIVISDKGKIFLGSDTGDIFLVYYKFSIYNMKESVIYIKNLTKYPIISFFQRLIPYNYPNIIQLSICTLQDDYYDDSIYIASLNSKSRIIFYHFTSKDGYSKLTEISQFMYNKKIHPELKKIIKVVSVPISDSLHTRFIAFTEDSQRLFFNAKTDINQQTDIYWYRERRAPKFDLDISRKILKDANYSLGVSVFLYEDYIVITQTTQNAHIANINPIENTVICPLKTNGLIFTRDNHIFRNHPYHIFNNEMLWQHSIDSPIGYLMTANGAHVVNFQLPVDRLSRILKESHGHYTENVYNWMRVNDKGSESSACALLLASRRAQSERSNELFVLYQYSNQKIRFDLEFTKSISFNLNSNDNQYAKWFNFEKHLEELNKMPESCEAFVMRAARLMKPIWDSRIFTKVKEQQQQQQQKKDQQQEKYQINTIYNQLPTTLLPNLKTLIELANEYLHIKSNNETKEEGIYLQETAILKKFINFMRMINETITFIQILKDQNADLLTSAMEYTDPQYKKFLTEVAFGKSIENHLQQSENSLYAALHDFATALFKANKDLPSLTNKIIDQCPNFFNEGDKIIIEKLESIENDNTLMTEIEQKLKEANEAFQKYSYRPLNLRKICDAFEKHKFYKGIADVCLSRADSLDPDSIALQWYHKDCNMNDNKGVEAFDRRYRCYEYIFQSDVFRNSSEIKLQEAFKSYLEKPDELFHICLYRYIIYQLRDKELIKLLLSSNSPHLELFLKQKAPQLLWKYQAQHKNYDLAAQSLLDIVKDKEDKCYSFVKNLIDNKNNSNTQNDKDEDVIQNENDEDNDFVPPNLIRRQKYLLKVISLSRGSGNFLLLNDAQRLYRLASIQISYNDKVKNFDGQNNYILDQKALLDLCSNRGYWGLVLQLFSFVAINTPNKEQSISKIWTNYLIQDIGQDELGNAQHSIVTLINNIYNNPSLSGTGKGSRIEVQNDVLSLNIILPIFEDFKYNRNGPCMWACETLLKCGIKPESLYKQYLRMVDNKALMAYSNKIDFIYIIAKLVSNNLNNSVPEHWDLHLFKDPMNWFINNCMDSEYYDDCFTIFNKIRNLL